MMSCWVSTPRTATRSKKNLADPAFVEDPVVKPGGAGVEIIRLDIGIALVEGGENASDVFDTGGCVPDQRAFLSRPLDQFRRVRVLAVDDRGQAELK